MMKEKERNKNFTHLFDVEVKNLLHEGGQLGHEGLVAVILAHVRDQDRPEGHRREYRLPRHWRRLSIRSRFS